MRCNRFWRAGGISVRQFQNTLFSSTVIVRGMNPLFLSFVPRRQVLAAVIKVEKSPLGGGRIKESSLRILHLLHFAIFFRSLHNKFFSQNNLCTWWTNWPLQIYDGLGTDDFSTLDFAHTHHFSLPNFLPLSVASSSHVAPPSHPSLPPPPSPPPPLPHMWEEGRSAPGIQARRKKNLFKNLLAPSSYYWVCPAALPLPSTPTPRKQFLFSQHAIWLTFTAPLRKGRGGASLAAAAPIKIFSFSSHPVSSIPLPPFFSLPRFTLFQCARLRSVNGLYPPCRCCWVLRQKKPNCLLANLIQSHPKVALSYIFVLVFSPCVCVLAAWWPADTSKASGRRVFSLLLLPSKIEPFKISSFSSRNYFGENFGRKVKKKGKKEKTILKENYT